MPCKLNLIPFNPFAASGLKRSPAARIAAFAEVLQAAGIVTTVRKTRGDDIDAACGQLAGAVQDRTRAATRMTRAPIRIQPARCPRPGAQRVTTTKHRTSGAVRARARRAGGLHDDDHDLAAHARGDRSVEHQSERSERGGTAHARAPRARQRLFRARPDETALDEVKLALQANPNSVEAYNLRGLIFARLADDAQADESFKRALQINPRDADTLHNYGWYQCQQRRYAEAQALFTQVQALPQFRDAPRVLLVQGVCQARAGQMAEAERSLARAFEVDPSNVAVQVNLAEVLYRRGELERARFYIKRVNNQPDQSNAQTLWLAAKIEHAAKQQHALDELGAQLHRRFPQSREAAAFEQGRFDEQ